MSHVVANFNIVIKELQNNNTKMVILNFDQT